MVKSNSNSNTEAIARLEAMRVHEDSTNSCYNYFQLSACDEQIDEACRKSMVIWCQQVQRALKLSPETVWIAVSFFDRYLSSGKGKSQEALNDRYKFQLAAITSFYAAVKIYETADLSVGALAKLCRGYYAVSDILSMETDILFALDWRVSCATPVEFARLFIKLLPDSIDAATTDILLAETQDHIDHTATDFYFTFCKPSVIGASCLASTLTGADFLSHSERQAFWMQLAKVTDLMEVMDAQKKILEGRPLTKPAAQEKQAKKSTDSSVTKKSSFYLERRRSIASGDSSPVCVMKVAPQA